MATRNVVLTPHQEQVIQGRVQSGRYQNASEVMREGLRLLEQRVAEDTAKIEALRQATSIGIMDLEYGAIHASRPNTPMGRSKAHAISCSIVWQTAT
jgi:putative addiction module CopG family antidote